MIEIFSMPFPFIAEYLVLFCRKVSFNIILVYDKYKKNRNVHMLIPNRAEKMRFVFSITRHCKCTCTHTQKHEMQANIFSSYLRDRLPMLERK